MTEALDHLSDDWTLFRGYKNAGGEIDHLLIGPGGVWAIEVKSSPYHIHVNGDKWTYDKYDKYDNYVGESGKLTDRGGRSWGQQVTVPAAKLEDFLATQGLDVSVNGAVVVLHERASFGDLNNLKTVVCVGPDFLLEQIDEEWQDTDQPTRRRIVELAERDHEFHARRQRKRPRR
jgi:hypothetical protein